MTARPRLHTLMLTASLATLALAAMPNASDAQPNLRGRWSSKNSTGACWGSVGAYGYCNGSEPVHMILTRNTVGGHHSQLLWYEGHQHAGGTWEGGLWGWDVATTTSGQNCSQYPQASFSSLSFSNPGYNIFCSGHSVLADGRVLLSGGTIGGEGGDKRSILFNPTTNTWALQDTMEHWRWYPTNTALPNGKVLVSSGSMYVDMQQFGGRTTPTGTTLHGDSLEKLALAPNAFWEVPAAKKQGYASSAWPASREGHSATWMKGTGSWILFGGRDAAGTGLLRDTWSMYRNFDNDHYETYSAVEYVGNPFASKPIPRHRHITAVPGDNVEYMFLFGGRTGLGTASSDIKNDLWKLYKNAGTWVWEEQSPSGMPPSARQGHTAFWDPEQRNVLVFGGADASENPIDGRMYKLHVPETGGVSWDTVFVEPDSLTGRSPSARHGHAFVYDEAEVSVEQGAPDHDYEYRAILWGGRGTIGMCSPDTVWMLWIPEEGSGKNYRWEHVVVAGSKPSARYRFGAAIEKATSFVVTGGDDGSSASSETWRLRLAALALPDSAQWTRAADNPKGASTGHTLLAAISKWARKQEIYDPATGDWSPLGTVKRQDWYPFHFVLPQTDVTRVFYAGPNDSTFLLDLSSSTKTWQHFPATMPAAWPYPRFRSGSAVMYLPAKFMRTGSRDTDGDGSGARGTTMTLDLAPLPGIQAWRDTVRWMVRDSMESRVNFNLVLLPDGKVFATGGTGWISNGGNVNPRCVPQIWDPGTMTWTTATGSDTLAREDAVRGYHSNAILLPDGRILAIGGNGTYSNDPAGNDARRATVYCPPYLFSSSGGLKPRITATPRAEVVFGSEFTVCTEGPNGNPPVSAVALIRPASSTHGWNMEQRYLPLSFQTECDGAGLIVTAPQNAHVAPPGDYLLFVRGSSSYAPSIGQWVRVGTEATTEDPLCLCEGGFGAMVAGGDGAQWSEENSLASRSDDATPLRLTKAPIGEDGRAVLRITQSGEATTTLEEVDLWSVDHLPGLEAFASATTNYVGTRVQALEARSILDGDVTSQALGQFGMSRQVEPGDTLVVETGGTDPTPFVVRARRASRQVPAVDADPIVHVESEIAPGRWRKLGRFEPRLDFADVTIDSGTSRVRLFGAMPFQVQGLARVEVAEASAVVARASESAARIGSTSDAVYADAGPVAPRSILGKGDSVESSWSEEPVGDGRVRTYFVRSHGKTVAQRGDFVARPRTTEEVEPSHTFALESARPNPSTGKTTIRYSLAQDARVTIRIYDAAGRIVRLLIDREGKAGPSEIVWDGTNDHGRRVPAGVCFYRMEAGEWISQKKVVVLGGPDR